MGSPLTDHPAEVAFQPVDQRAQKYGVDIVGSMDFTHRRGELFEGL
jgi:hypothetical protein